MNAPIPSMEAPRGVERQRVKFIDQPLGAFLNRDLALLSTHVGAHPAGMIDADSNPVALEISCQIAPDIQRCRLRRAIGIGSPGAREWLAICEEMIAIFGSFASFRFGSIACTVRKTPVTLTASDLAQTSAV